MVGMHGDRFEGLILGLAPGDEILIQNPAGHFGEGKFVKGSPDMASHIPQLEASGDDRVDRSAGNDTQLAEGRNGIGQFPVGDTNAHAALNNFRILHK